MDWYDHRANQKKTQYRSNKHCSDPYSEYDHNPEIVNQRKFMLPAPKKEPEILVVHRLSFVFNFTSVVVGLYFLAKLLFLLYNAGESVECIFNYPV